MTGQGMADRFQVRGMMSELAIPRFYHVVKAHYAELRAFAVRRLRNRAIAEEIVQEAYLRLAGHRDEVVENPRAYLYRVVGNLVTDHQRRERVHSQVATGLTVTVDAIDPATDIERQLIARERLALLSQAIAELPPRCRECFILRRFDDLSQEEVARRMGISRSMVEKHLRLALVHCTRRLRESD